VSTRWLSMLALLAVVGCGAPLTRSATAVGHAGPSALTAYLLPRAAMQAHVRFGALSELEPHGNGLRVLTTLAGEALPDALDLSGPCGIETPEALDELAVSVDADGVLFAARTPLRDAAARRCALALSPDARETTFEGRDAVRIGDLVAVAERGLVLLGSESHVRAALEEPPGGAKADAMESLGAASDAYVRVYSQLEDGLYAAGLMQLGAAGDGLEMRYALFSKTVEDADLIDRRYRSTLGLMRDRPESAVAELVPLIDRLDVRRSVGAATVVRAEIPRKGTVEAIADMVELHRRVEIGLSLWRHFENAESQLHRIAQALVDHVAREREQKRPARFPPSAGPTPSELPPSNGTVMTRHDWRDPTWVLLGHALEGPVFHRYELVVDPTRRRATLRASSDLDGDGDPFVLELTLTIRRDGTVDVGDIEVAGKRR
jgi:hypothetical protein